MKFGKVKSKRPEKVGTLRRSQFIVGAGTGAIVDMVKESVIMAGTDFWKNHVNRFYRVEEPNLQKYLGVDYFVSPAPVIGMSSGNDDEFSQDLPAFRFPNWMFCPKCKRLAHESFFGFNKHPQCGRCKKDLVPSRFVVACPGGHLDDFPYEWWVHEGNRRPKCKRPELYIYTNEKSSGLNSIVIHCKTCGVSRSMANSFSIEFKCTARRPWLNDKESECDKRMRTLQRGASNLYFPINASALSIPPWSLKVQKELEYIWHVLQGIIHDRETFKIVVQSAGIPQKCNCTPEEIYEQALVRHRHLQSQEEKTWQDILEDEYRAFIKGESDEEGEFKIRNEEVPDALKDFVERVVLAEKLREVMALRGFKRITPEFDEKDENSFCRLSKDYKRWLPGMELKGEGIFIKLNEDKVKE